MTFGKSQDPKLEGTKGGKSQSDMRNSKLSISLKKKWKDPEYRKRHIVVINEINAKRTKEELSNMGKRSRLHENIVEDRLKGDFDFVFQTI